MGVKGLWTVLAPFCDRKPLYEIGGETVAVDLSGWVCDSQNVSEHHSQPKLYLRNLYFRTSYLLLYDVIPVFVLEGQAPEMKRKAMEARRQLQYTRAKQGKSGDISRKRFKNVLTQCENLLGSMGLQCVVGAGEAEAMCAHLNASGLVAGVISQDSDCFVYGATRIYRNFSVGTGGAGSVDVYDLARVQKSMDLGRNKMVALALLCGSDYNGTGVDGVGMTSAFSFLQQHSDVDIIPRLVAWNTDVQQYKEWERRIEDPTSCTTCGHGGPLRIHTRQGCPTCGTNKGCHSGKYKDWRLNMKLELQIRSKAMNSSEAFPDPALLKEFLHHKETTPPRFNPSWGKPDLIKFTKLMTKWLGWSECYCLEKFLPLMTRWQLLHPGDCTLHPKTIVKKRNPRGVACYQVLWTDPNGLYDGLITDEQIAEAEITFEDLWTTVERQELFGRVYPELVEEFEASKVKKKKEKTGERKKKQAKKDKDGSMVEAGEKIEKGKRGRKRKAVGDVSFKTKSTDTKKKMDEVGKKKKGVQKTLHSFIAKNHVDNNVKHDGMSPLLTRKLHLFDDDLNKTADLLKNLSLDMYDEVDESDLSNIVENIVTRENCIDFDVKVLNVNKFSTPNGKCDNSVNKKINGLDNKNRRISYFFGPLNDDYDAFEKSIELKNAPDVDLNITSNDDSVKRGKSKTKNVSKCNSNKENVCNNSFDGGLTVDSDNKFKLCDNGVNNIKDNNLLRKSIGALDNDVNFYKNHVTNCDNVVKMCDNNVKIDRSINENFDNDDSGFKTRDSDVNLFDNGVKIVDNDVKSSKVLSLEERLFGIGNDCDADDIPCSTSSGRTERNSRCTDSSSIVYTPLAERIRRLKDQL